MYNLTPVFKQQFLTRTETLTDYSTTDANEADVKKLFLTWTNTLTDYFTRDANEADVKKLFLTRTNTLTDRSIRDADEVQVTSPTCFVSSSMQIAPPPSTYPPDTTGLITRTKGGSHGNVSCKKTTGLKK